jgi:hypothetical protein
VVTEAGAGCIPGASSPVRNTAFPRRACSRKDGPGGGQGRQPAPELPPRLAGAERPPLSTAPPIYSHASGNRCCARLRLWTGCYGCARVCLTRECISGVSPLSTTDGNSGVAARRKPGTTCALPQRDLCSETAVSLCMEAAFLLCSEAAFLLCSEAAFLLCSEAAFLLSDQTDSA